MNNVYRFYVRSKYQPIFHKELLIFIIQIYCHSKELFFSESLDYKIENLNKIFPLSNCKQIKHLSSLN